MTAIRENFDKTKFYVPDTLVCRVKPDPELVMLCQQKGEGVHRGTPLGKLKAMWPFDGLKRALTEEATTFVGHMAKQGNQLQTSIYEIEVWGPYRDKPMGAEEVNIEAGNHLVPDGKFAFAPKGAWQPETLGPRRITQSLLDRGDFRHGICYRLRGKFLKTRGKQDDITGVVIL